ncbi:superoxide dismutase family protein [Motilibacter aurantiacus]|uniref:superoxide dismutase family protein n=1 Tax=Motilibacter aurantiacus TaxID=2714955 RepID=UPI00140DFA99|nr:superoxide dismutase family protein [Motilibacter aurantiacus]NHC46334.1 superoxide dismutase [Motilibacter aurantiacus]
MPSTTSHRPLLLPLAGAAALTLAAGIAAPAATAADRVRERGDVVRYDTALVPEDARARVTATYDRKGGTEVVLRVRGLLPDREYGAHVHVNACGATGAAAGPHYQYVVDPVQPSVDPAYANPENEIWLDFTTDARGNAVARAEVDWQFPANRRAGSVVIHAEHTSTEPGMAGMAGARVGCVTAPF